MLAALALLIAAIFNATTRCTDIPMPGTHTSLFDYATGASYIGYSSIIGSC